MPVISQQSDASLLDEFATTRSQEAFSALVSRHTDWVYWAALRMVRDQHLAEDVVQAVFIVLAEKAGKLRGIPLHRWLFKVTRYCASNAIRARDRREKHERRAAMAKTEIHQPDTDFTWQEIAPVLDDSINRLRSKDRDAVLLRFYQQKEIPEVAAALGVSEGAAKVRIIRAVEKLRNILRRRKTAITAADLSAALALHLSHPAPAHIAGEVATGTASASASTIAKGASTMMTIAKIKIAIAVLVMLGIPLGAGAIYAMDSHSQPAAAPPPPPAQAVDNPPAPPAENVPGLDPRVAPFVNNHTDLILAADITKIDVDGLVADVHTELNAKAIDPGAAAHINGMLQMALTAGKNWINGFARSGGSTMFIVASADQLMPPNGGNPSLHFSHATVIFPTDSPQAAQTLMQFLASPGSPGTTIIGNAVVINPPTWEPSFGQGAQQALADGLAAGNDNPVRAAINPQKLAMVMSTLLASGKVSTALDQTNYQGVQFASISLSLSPGQAFGFHGITHYADAAAAQAAAAKATQRMNRVISEQAANSSPVAKAMCDFLRSETFTAQGSNVVTTMDLHTYWDLVFSAKINAPSTTRPQMSSPNGL